MSHMSASPSRLVCDSALDPGLLETNTLYAEYRGINAALALLTSAESEVSAADLRNLAEVQGVSNLNVAHAHRKLDDVARSHLHAPVVHMDASIDLGRLLQGLYILRLGFDVCVSVAHELLDALHRRLLGLQRESGGMEVAQCAMRKREGCARNRGGSEVALEHRSKEPEHDEISLTSALALEI